MKTLEFIADDRKTKPEGSYEVKYQPPRGRIHGTAGGCFSNLLLEAVCDLPEDNSKKEDILVTTKGNFPIKYLGELEKVFGFYAKSEGVKVTIRKKE
ncbi:MAG TPA: hypothetical protein VJB94_01040 [Candidatus Nanoarchaeia archaeon]|nr:hypothetical protein [Candidatus Nanoarchaeia archaeon]